MPKLELLWDVRDPPYSNVEIIIAIEISKPYIETSTPYRRGCTQESCHFER